MTLVNASGGLLIYSTSILRFVARPGPLTPQKLLREVLAVTSNHTTSHASKSPFAELDALYTLIMERISPEMFASIRLYYVFSIRL